MTKEKQKLWNFIVNKIPYAIHFNPNCEYSAEEYDKSKKLLELDLKAFKENEQKYMIQSFACLLRSINSYKQVFENWENKDFKEKGETWKQYHKMIPEFNRVMQSLVFKNYRGNLEVGGKLFPIQEIIFQGAETGDKIVLSGPILEIFRAMFKSFDDVISEEDKKRMKEFSNDLYKAWQEFMKEWSVLTADGALAKQLRKNREETEIEKALARYKYTIAYNIHSALIRLVNRKSSAKYPSLNKRIIGKLLNEAGLFDYNGWVDDKNIENFIIRGNPERPENITKTKKPKK